MTILHYNNIEVELLETYECGGVKLAAIQAKEGQPFADGARTTTRTAYLTVKASDLVITRAEPAPQPSQAPSLLTLALDAAKPTWATGESVWIYGGPRSGAFLKNHGEQVCLHLVGAYLSCPIFYLDPRTWTWQPAANVREDYQAWTHQVKGELARNQARARVTA